MAFLDGSDTCVDVSQHTAHAVRRPIAAAAAAAAAVTAKPTLE